MDPRADALPAVQSDEAWLTELNRWRTEAGVQPVGENAALSGAAEDHACYLVKNGPQDPAEFIQYEHRLGASAHSEDSDNQHFTMDGNQAAHTGDVAFDRSPQADVNGLVEVAFHRLSILAPWMHVAGYGDCGHWPVRASTLVIRGSAPAGTTKAVLFPPDGSTVRGAMPTAEWPNPLEACPGYTFPVGTPITVQTGAAVKAELKSYSVTDQSTGQQVEACGFDFQTYPAQWGQRLLLSYGAVVVVPRHPLSSGHTYAVNIATQRRTYSWTFNVGAAPSAQTANARQPGS